MDTVVPMMETAWPATGGRLPGNSYFTHGEPMHGRNGRGALLGAVVLLGLLTGSVCEVPVLPPVGTSVALPSVTLVLPDADAFIAPGQIVDIQWADVVGDNPATITVRAEPAAIEGADENDPQPAPAAVTLLTDRDAGADGPQDTIAWDTTGAAGGVYRITVTIADTAGNVDSASSAALIVINSPPSLTFLTPAANVNFAAGDTYRITWTDRETDSDLATITLALDLDGLNDSGDEIVILSGRNLNIDGDSDEFTWAGNDETGTPVPPGLYSLVAVLTDGVSPPAYVRAPGRINKLNTAPTIDMIQPATNQTPDTNASVTVSWLAIDPDDDATITLKYDDDTTPEEGDETEIETGISEDDTTQTSWDTTGVPAGTYYVYALIDDGKATATSYAGGDTPVTVTVKNAVPTFEFTAPATDVEADPAASGVVNIAWTDSDPDDDADIDLFLDPDAFHANGNEIQIANDLSEDDAADALAWNSAGTDVGTYTLFATIDDGTNPATTVEAAGRVILRNAADPVVQATAPVANLNVALGDQPTISWTVDDPSGGNARVHVSYDDDPTPNEAAETGAAEGVIQTNIDPATTTSLEWDWQGTVAAGTYYVFVYVDDDGDLPPQNAAIDDVAVAAGTVTLPNSPPSLSWVLTTTAGDVGDVINLDWTDEDPDDNAAISVYADPDTKRNNGNEILIGTRNEDDEGAGNDDVDWNTVGVEPGIYEIYAVLNDGTNPPVTEVAGTAQRLKVRKATDDGDGQPEPTIVLTAPVNDTSVGANGSVTIRWDDDFPAGTDDARITLRYDDDPTPNEAAETGAAETTIIANLIAANDSGTNDQHVWNMTGLPGGDFYVFAYIDDAGDPPGDNSDDIAAAPGKITRPNTAPTFIFTAPLVEQDTFIGGGANVAITWNDSDPDLQDDAVILLAIDVDANHANGNELVIRNGISEDDAADAVPGGWDLTDTVGGNVPSGWYYLYSVITDGKASPVTTNADGRIKVRSANGAAVVNLTTQLDPATITAGQTLTITWEDDDPDHNAYLTVVVTDSATPPANKAAATGLPANQQVVVGRREDPDGAQDSAVWLVPGALDPAQTWYVHAMIDDTDDGTWEDTITSAPLTFPD